ncbi:unnamed protein product [Sphagnum tenellum]
MSGSSSGNCSNDIVFAKVLRAHGADAFIEGTCCLAWKLAGGAILDHDDGVNPYQGRVQVVPAVADDFSTLTRSLNGRHLVDTIWKEKLESRLQINVCVTVRVGRGCGRRIWRPPVEAWTRMPSASTR